MNAYALEITALDETVAAVTPTPKHDALLRSIHNCADLRDAKLATSRGGSYRALRKVVTAAGDLVHDDHTVWLRSEVQADGGDLAATMARLKEFDYRLTECEITRLYVVQDGGGRQEDFLQLTIVQEDEFIDSRLFNSSYTWVTELQDLEDLRSASEEGHRFEGAARGRFRPTQYRLEQGIDIAKFLREGSAINSERREASARRVLLVTDDDGQSRRVTAGEFHKEVNPRVEDFGWAGQRFFDDWTMSSAGRSRARLCDHWVLQTSDYTDFSGDRLISYVPLWTFSRKLAEIKRAPRSVYELFGKLEVLDHRLQVPFGWYFYMLHGNRVHDWAASHIISAAEAGKIVLAERDYRVLKRWQAQPYGF